MNSNKILYAIKQNTCFIKMLGEIRLRLSSGFDSLVRRELENKRINQFVIDLRKAEYLDSTNLGLLCTIATRMKSDYNQKPTIVSPTNDVKIILDSMGMDNLFEYTDTVDDSKLKYFDTSGIKKQLRETNDFVLDSHQTLSEMSEVNKKQFVGVVDAILKKKNKPA